MNSVATSVVAGTELLRAIERREAARRTLALLLVAGAGALALGLWMWHWPAARPALGAGLAFLLLAAGAGTYYLHRSQLPALARRLDRLYPELEDSTGLLLQSSSHNATTLLARLQQQRIQERLAALQQHTSYLLPFSWRPFGLAAGLLLTLGAAGALYQPRNQAATAPALAVKFPGVTEAAAQPGQAALPRLLDTHIRVVPPAYTRRAAFAPSSLSFTCPTGSRVRWTARVNRATGTPPELTLGTQHVKFKAVAGRPTEFVAEMVVTASGLYHLRFAGQTSDDYALTVQPDQAPTVQIQTPKPYTLVEFGQSAQVAVRVALHDDYGLTNAQLVATVAQGQGEAVKFREVVTDMSRGLGGQPQQATAAATLNLPKLGLTYGDEVYFYVRVRDNARHLIRSDTYLVQWEDTTVQDGLTDISLGVNVVPAYFRSQRQIIIDTEKLMAERSSLPAATFAERANNLGLDQKLLRLRYGKFLGEEASGNIGGDVAHAPTADGEAAEHEEPGGEEHHEHAPASDRAPTGEAAAASSTAELMEPYMHRHDDEETADFLEPAVKAKLRGVLNQMWEAELRLRLAKPAEARPYEYRALRLLKQVQQQTRAYVRKSGFEPPILPESTARLSGDLTGAAAPRRTQQVPPPATKPTVAAALQLLGAVRTGQPMRATDAATLERAGQAVAQAALQRPGAYLAGIRALRQLATDARAGHVPCGTCLAPAEAALASLLPVPRAAPSRPSRPDRLGQRYLEQL